MGKESERPAFRTTRVDRLRGRRLLWTVMLLAVATVLSAIKPVVLPDGGSVTYFSLLFLWLVTFFYGPRWGVCAGFVFGFLKLAVTYVTGEFVNFDLGALALEYPIGCAAVALGSLVVDRAGVSRGDGNVVRDGFGLRVGYLLGVLSLGVCYVLAANLFYAPDRPSLLGNLLFTIGYDMSYLLVEAGLTILVLCIPAVANGIYYLRYLATVPLSDPTLRSF